ncbi:hypothetical protein [Salinispira pacifica]|nr:hypothetical protein [Salinispira pacifica]
MKNLFRLLFVLIGLALLGSCASMNNLGQYVPENMDSSEMVQLTISGSVGVSSINGESVDWPVSSLMRIGRMVELPAGYYRFSVSYDDGHVYTFGTSPVYAKLEPGRSYRLYGRKGLSSNRINYRVTDTISNDDAVVLEEEYRAAHSSSTEQGDIQVIGSYITHVLNHTMDEVGNTVILENEQMILVFQPDLLFTMLDKSTNEITEGRRGFNMNLNTKVGKSYLLFVDPDEMSKDEFLENSNYPTEAEWAMIPTSASAEQIIYTIERPVERKGEAIPFSITVVEEWNGFGNE